MTNVNDIVKTTISLRSYEFGSANIRLFESYGEGLPAVFVNPEEIQQVILNLILNAEQAMRSAHRGGTLTVTTKCVDAMVTIEIQDDGPGVPAALAGRVFEPFFSTKEVGEGTGLGLSIAMGIAEAHGGTLTLVPTSKGACFRLSLPAIDPTEDLPVASLVSASSAGNSRPPSLPWLRANSKEQNPSPALCICSLLSALCSMLSALSSKPASDASWNVPWQVERLADLMRQSINGEGLLDKVRGRLLHAETQDVVV